MTVQTRGSRFHSTCPATRGLHLDRQQLAHSNDAGTVIGMMDESRYRRMFDAVQAGIIVQRADGEIVYANRMAAEILPPLAGDPVAMSSTDPAWRMSLADGTPVPGEDHPSMITLRTGKPLRNQVRGLFADDPAGTRWLLVNTEPVFEGDGRKPAEVIITFVDISELRRAEDTLRAERDRVQQYLDIASVMLVALDREGEVTLANRKALSLLGCREDELLGRNWFECCIPAASRAEVKTVFSRIMNGELEALEAFENHVQTRAGGMRLIAWRNTYLRDAAGRIIGTLSSGEDITDRREAEREREVLREQLLQSQKMEAIGRLAGGIAHDFNNLLTVIINNGDMLLESVSLSDPARRDIADIGRAARRAADLTSQLLSFSRKQIIDPRDIDINEAVARAEIMLRRLIGEDIDLLVMPDRDLKPTNFDPGQIEQILFNLAVNARDAMPTGGKLTIETQNVELDETYHRNHLQTRPGSYVMLAVSDSGQGMDEQTQKLVFEPFFTTKDTGQGTGLGLSTVYGIVKQHGGSIELYSELGRGTTIKILLPSSETPAGASAAKRERTAPAGSETILLLEDEQEVRRITRRILARLGYTVLEAAHPDEAIRLGGAEGAEMDLLLTDVVLPRMSGKTCFDELRAHMPDLKVIYMSGYTENVIAHRGVLDDGTHFLQKPFTKETLARKVREVLDS
ncbi:PAS domain S-box protein [bacterium]|nr:PAS domain S-box protein [bacterium]MBU1073525.1 PAS domain S-box protein [bacterium]MBU1676417.1 PAS domain S-box protein [bacterium]